MAKYILNPRYGDMSVVYLGSSVKSIKNKLEEHWMYELDEPEEYDKEHVKNLNLILNEEYSSVEKLMEDYNRLMDEDYSFEEAY